MPSFHDSADSEGAPEEVWKLLYDPSRFPQWWVGIGTVELGEGRVGGDGDEVGGSYTMYPEGYPDFPMAQLLETDRDERRVKVSCMVSDLIFEWRLEARTGAGEGAGGVGGAGGAGGVGGPGGTRISVAVEIPESEGARLESQREAIGASLRNLARLAGKPDV